MANKFTAAQITTQPVSKTLVAGSNTTLSVVSPTIGVTLQWYCGGRPVAGGTGGTLSLNSIAPANAGIYYAVLSQPYSGSTRSGLAVVGVVPASGSRTAGSVTTRAEWQDIHHHNGSIYDQFQLSGAAGTFTADPGQIARMSYLDSNNSIVQVEMSGAGAITVVLDNASGPLVPALYTQTGIQYMKGDATVILAGADETTHISIYSVGTVTNPGVTRSGVNYVGWAAVRAMGIVSASGRLGGIHQGNVAYGASEGVTGIVAPTVTSVAQLPVVHDIVASGTARPYLCFGEAGRGTVKIAGGALGQPNDAFITVDGLQGVQMGAGQDSCGRAAPAQAAAGLLVTTAGRYGTTSITTWPAVTTHPSDLLGPIGATANFTVAASGTPTLTYQWLLNGQPAAGHTEASFGAFTIEDLHNGGTYGCVVTNAAGSVTSRTATLTVGPDIISQPADVYGELGGNADFSVVATSGSALTYQWLLNGLPLADHTASSFGSFKIEDFHNGWTFACVVTSPYGSVTSRAATLVRATGFAPIPAGTFTMGDSLDGDSNALPLHSVTLPAFSMAKTLTTWAEWQMVRIWAVAHGYTDLVYGAGKAATHPVYNVSWYDVVKWSNAKSEMEGLTPCYYINDAQTSVYRTGTVDVTKAQVKWTANGYRLPTEAEWEYAARGGLAGKRFPWGDTISHTQANYASSAAYAYDVSTTRGFHPDYASGYFYTSPVGAFAANGYGLYDMAGNLYQWCWDWYGGYGSAAQTAPQGPAWGSVRVFRGGSWGSQTFNNRSAYRFWHDPDYINLGFRLCLAP